MASTAVAPALRALLEHLVDYAGLFPPASLSMREAVSEYAAQRSASASWMLGRFVVPVARLGELATEVRSGGFARDGAWPLTVLLGADVAGDTATIRAFGEAHATLLSTQSVELRTTTSSAVGKALSPLDNSLERYVELPLDQELTPLLEAVKRHHAFAKVRTGGVTPDAFPSTEALADFIHACARLEVPFKATAGLHHPVRGTQPLTYETDAGTTTMFGFLNVFVAAALAGAGADRATLVRVLDERDAAAFSFESDAVRWHNAMVTLPQLGRARELARSFGSCSFREPVSDLATLGIL
jgi:hypothetical protein